MDTNRPVIIVSVGALIAAVAAVATAAAVLVGPRAPSVGNPLLPIAAAAPAQEDTLTVVGQGSGTGVPDQARVILGVAATRGSAQDAVSTAGSELSHLVSTLHDQGVGDADIQTTSINVIQETNCCPRNVTGYTAETDVAVLIHHLNNVGALIAAATQAIGNDIRINGVSLSISDPSAAIKTARSAAMTDAAARAKQWAGLAGRQVGRMIGVSEVVSAPGQPACSGGCGGGGIPVQAGQSAVTVTVTVAYRLEG